MTEFVIDANIAVAAFVDLPYSQRARDLLSDAERILAPDLILHEFGNTLWKLVTTGKMTIGFAHDAITGLIALVNDLVDGRLLAHEALRLATELRHPVYDCFYLALAFNRDAPFVTADRRFAAKLADTNVAGRVQLIGP